MAVWFAGCDEMAATSPQALPPFVVSESGPGFSPETDGVLIRFVEGTRADGAMRISNDGLRVYSEHGERLGRLRRSAEGFVLELRDGTDVCQATLAPPEATLACGDRVWRAATDSASGGLTLSLADGTTVNIVGDRDRAHAELAQGTRVEGERSGTELLIASGAWQRRARDLRGVLDARAVVVREVVRHAGSNTGEVPDLLVASALLWMAQRIGPVGPPADGQSAAPSSTPDAAAAQNAPPSSPTVGSGSSATTAEGSVPAAGL